MKRSRKVRFLCFVLTFLLIQNCFGFSAEAKNESEDNIFYGNIQVFGVDAAETLTYQGARDSDGKVYIHMQDLAHILAGTVSQMKNSDKYQYTVDSWNIVVNPKENEAQVFFYAFNTYEKVKLPKCIYNEEKSAWYLPFEEMLYLSNTQWTCLEQTVFVYRPETLLDVAADMNRLRKSNPTYEDIMGDDAWEQWGNARKYGFRAAIDEIDMTFLWDSFLTAWGGKETMTYEDEVLEAAVVMLHADSPQGNEYTLSDDVFDGIGGFVEGISNTGDFATQDAVLDVVQKIAGVELPKDQIDAFSNKFSIGTGLLSYALNVGQGLYIRDTMPENFKDRLECIKEVCEGGEKGTFKKRLYNAAEEVNELCYESVCNAYLQGIKWADVLSMADSVAGAAGVGFLPIGMVDMTVKVIDSVVEVSKLTIPAVKKALEEAEEVHISLDFVEISVIMNQGYEDALKKVVYGEVDLNKESLDEIRVRAQVAQCAAMHAHSKLIEIEKMPLTSSLPEQEMLLRLSESAKYDRLLMHDPTFADLYTNETGCVRTKIPPEYVFGLPVIEFSFDAGVEDLEVTPSIPGAKLPEGQKLTVTCKTDSDGLFVEQIILKHETYGEYVYKLNTDLLVTHGGELLGIDMGDGEYSYAIITWMEGTIGGSESIIIRPVDGQLQRVKTFTLAERTDEIWVEGKFLDAETVSGVIHPTEVKFEDKVSDPMPERKGTEIFENGTGILEYELNEDGYYDFIFRTVERNQYNIDVVGGSRTRYVLKNQELVLEEQWYEVR